MKIVLLSLVALALCKALPTYPDKYYVEADFAMPLGNMSFPLTGAVDATDPDNVLWKFSWYHDLDYTVQNESGQYNVYVAKDHVHCDKGGQGAMAYPMFPDFTADDWEYEGTAVVHQRTCDHWRMLDPQGGKTNVYDFYAEADGTPVMWRMTGYNVLTESHFDLYVLTYFNYRTDIPDGTFAIPDECAAARGVASTRNRVGPLLRGLFHHHRSFEGFERQYGRQYHDHKERAHRRKIFKANVAMIKAHNRDKTQSFTLEVNQFADLHPDEFRQLFTGYQKRPNGLYKPDLARRYQAGKTALPDEIDWRLRGAVSRVKDQGPCGSCWTFGTMGTVEGAIAIASGELTHFSEQSIVDCFWDPENKGCDGGEHEDALAFLVKQGGMSLEHLYPYKGVDDWCYYTKDLAKGHNISDWASTIHGDEGDLQMHLSEGPVAIAIDVTDKMIFYSEGIFDDPECKSGNADLDHSVTAVGYASEAGRDYYIVKNSWSPRWGSDGYIFIERNNDNKCGVATSAAFAIV